DEAFIRRHLDALALEVDAADGVVLDAVEVAVLDPLAQLVVALDHLGEILPPEARYVALERAGVRLAAGAQRAVTREAVELDGEIGALRGLLFFREELAGRRAQ